jgi:hypothetical protein
VVNMASQYAPDVKAEALAVYLDHGAAEAARQTGIPNGTIRSWAHRDGVATVAAQNTRAATEAARVQWEQRRLELADEIGEAAEEALNLVDAALQEGDAHAAKAAAVTVGVLIDKAELLSGRATKRLRGSRA